MSSHPGKSYPTFQLKISEEAIYSNASKEKLFGYAIEAPKGPIDEPTFIASNEEALKTFGVDFAPHFYQKSGGLVITRVGLPNAQSASITYCVKTTTVSTPTETTETTEPTSGSGTEEPSGSGTEEQTQETSGDNDDSSIAVSFMEAFTITAVDKGQSNITVRVIESYGVTGGYTLIIDIPGVTSRTFNNLLTFRDIVKTINNKFAAYIKAEQKADPDTHQLINGLEPQQELVVLKEGETVSVNSTESQFTALDDSDGILMGGSYGRLFKKNATMTQIKLAEQLDGSYDDEVLQNDPVPDFILYSGKDEDFDGDSVRTDITLTAAVVYKKAFDLTILTINIDKLCIIIQFIS